MHSASTCRHSRLCSTWAISQRKSFHCCAIRHTHVRRVDSFTPCTRSYVNHVAQDSQSDSHNSPPALADDSIFHPDDPGIRGKLDDSLPYVAVLKARKQHKHPVQEKQKALGKASYCLVNALQVICNTRPLMLSCSGLHEAASKPVLSAGCKENRASG